MSSRLLNKMYKKDVIKQFDSKGIESISEFCALTFIPLIDAYQIIYDYSECNKIKDFCKNKIYNLNQFYLNRF